MSSVTKRSNRNSTGHKTKVATLPDHRGKFEFSTYRKFWDGWSSKMKNQNETQGYNLAAHALSNKGPTTLFKRQTAMAQTKPFSFLDKKYIDAKNNEKVMPGDSKLYYESFNKNHRQRQGRPLPSDQALRLDMKDDNFTKYTLDDVPVNAKGIPKEIELMRKLEVQKKMQPEKRFIDDEPADMIVLKSSNGRHEGFESQSEQNMFGGWTGLFFVTGSVAFGTNRWLNKRSMGSDGSSGSSMLISLVTGIIGGLIYVNMVAGDTEYAEGFRSDGNSTTAGRVDSTRQFVVANPRFSYAQLNAPPYDVIDYRDHWKQPVWNWGVHGKDPVMDKTSEQISNKLPNELGIWKPTGPSSESRLGDVVFGSASKLAGAATTADLKKLRDGRVHKILKTAPKPDTRGRNSRWNPALKYRKDSADNYYGAIDSLQAAETFNNIGADRIEAHNGGRQWVKRKLGTIAQRAERPNVHNRFERYAIGASRKGEKHLEDRRNIGLETQFNYMNSKQDLFPSSWRGRYSVLGQPYQTDHVLFTVGDTKARLQTKNGRDIYSAKR